MMSHTLKLCVVNKSLPQPMMALGWGQTSQSTILTPSWVGGSAVQVKQRCSGGRKGPHLYHALNSLPDSSANPLISTSQFCWVIWLGRLSPPGLFSE